MVLLIALSVKTSSPPSDAVGVEGGIDVDEVDAGVGELLELLQVVAAVDDAGIDERAGFYHAGKMSEKGRSVKEEIGCPGRPARHFHGMTLGKLLASLSQQRDVCMNGYRPAGADSLVPVAAAAEFRRVLETGGDGTGIIAQQRALCRWGKDLPVALFLDPAREGGLEHRVWPVGPDILKVTYGGAYGRTVRRMRNGTLAFPVSLDEIGYL